VVTARRYDRRPIVTLGNVATGYIGRHGDASTITRDINASLRAGELTCLLGPNGAGKSTLMRTIVGMQPALAGVVEIDGRDVRRMSARDVARVVGVVLTDRITVNMLSAYALVALGRHPHTNWLGELTDADHAAIREAMSLTGAADLAERLVTELSDGERQRVMVARALAQEPRVLVLDEITAFLDLPRRVEIMGMLRQLAHESGRAMLLSTHDLDIALRASDRIWLMPKRGAMTVGAPEDLVLGGAFEAAFASEGIRFQPELGTFRIQTTPRGRVRLECPAGLTRIWTARGLERAGFEVAEDASTALHVEQAGGRTRWRLAPDAGPAVESIEDLFEMMVSASSVEHSVSR
jgi:iron complex transport system ATP-binding protein